MLGAESSAVVAAGSGARSQPVLKDTVASINPAAPANMAILNRFRNSIPQDYTVSYSSVCGASPLILAGQYPTTFGFGIACFDFSCPGKRMLLTVIFTLSVTISWPRVDLQFAGLYADLSGMDRQD